MNVQFVYAGKKGKEKDKEKDKEKEKSKANDDDEEDPSYLKSDSLVSRDRNHI